MTRARAQHAHLFQRCPSHGPRLTASSHRRLRWILSHLCAHPTPPPLPHHSKSFGHVSPSLTSALPMSHHAIPPLHLSLFSMCSHPVPLLHAVSPFPICPPHASGAHATPYHAIIRPRPLCCLSRCRPARPFPTSLSCVRLSPRRLPHAPSSQSHPSAVSRHVFICPEARFDLLSQPRCAVANGACRPPAVASTQRALAGQPQAAVTEYTGTVCRHWKGRGHQDNQALSTGWRAGTGIGVAITMVMCHGSVDHGHGSVGHSQPPCATWLWPSQPTAINTASERARGLSAQWLGYTHRSHPRWLGLQPRAAGSSPSRALG